MTAYSLIETGICPWFERESLKSSFTTISVVALSLEKLLPRINEINSKLCDTFASWYRWHTLGQAFDGNSLQRRKLVASFGAELGRFGVPVVRANHEILTSVSIIHYPITTLELDALSDYRRTLVIGTSIRAVTAIEISSLMEPFSSGCDCRALAEILVLKPELILGRCYHDVDTHAAFQWYGTETNMQLISSVLSEIGFQALKSREQVANLLR